MRKMLPLTSLMLLGAACCAPLDAEVSRADVRVESIRVQPDRASAADPVTVYAMLRNAGSGQAENIFISVEIKQKDRRVRKIEEVPVLSELPHSGAGLSIPVAIGKLAAGDYTAEVWVLESNQYASASFHVSPAPKRVTHKP